MNKNTISTRTSATRTKRVAIGAASALAAGALLGVGAQGATAAPLNASSDTESSSSSSVHAGTKGAVLAALKVELRADLSEGTDIGDKAQNVAETLSGHAALFERLPEKLQTDLTSLKEASEADRTTLATTITATALAGGYGEQVKEFAQEIQADPAHPLDGLRTVLQGDQAEAGAKGQSVEKIAQKLLDNPVLFDKLPESLQTDLTAVKDASDADRAAALQNVETSALAGEYGKTVQTIAERILSDTHATGGAHAEVETGGN
ncbi:hypothetical protein E3T33_12725 [Cryobacterium sp. TMT1-2-1]|uniref:hypothetical protein n=1 Tax=Cryobacterium sp. TMT1-2-1 TaxID=1259232 RepID=UPI0010696771|nr:hypothetical protein [Cryobacterium sp. TMT1-2-1]TFD42358.1 hypothetical protein E3T33_12725 [Cryobacterium sp. TMT1-2-1]